jgi:hypothetical protein
MACETAPPVDAIGRASVLMLRTWLAKISPDTGNPPGNTTLVPNGRIFDVIGHTMATPLACQKAEGDTTSAGRFPLCSRPTLGSKSVQIKSPASGR